MNNYYERPDPKTIEGYCIHCDDELYAGDYELRVSSFLEDWVRIHENCIVEFICKLINNSTNEHLEDFFENYMVEITIINDSNKSVQQLNACKYIKELSPKNLRILVEAREVYE